MNCLNKWKSSHVECMLRNNNLSVWTKSDIHCFVQKVVISNHTSYLLAKTVYGNTRRKQITRLGRGNKLCQTMLSSQSSWKRVDIGNGGHPCHWLNACATSSWCGFRTSGLLLPKRVHNRKLCMSDQQPQMYSHVQIENLCKSATQWWPSWSKYNWSRTSGYLNFKKSDLTRC